MDRLNCVWVCLLCWACSPASEAQPVPLASTPIASPAKPTPAPTLEPTEFPADCCVLEVFRPSDGYTFRLYLDGRATQHKAGGPVEQIQPYDPTLTAHAHTRADFVRAQQSAWNAAIAAEWLPGPPLRSGTKLPGGPSLQVEPLLFRSRGPEGVLSRTIEGDIRHAPSLGSFAEPWTTLSQRLWAPGR